MATLATLLFTPALSGGATVIGSVPYTITTPGQYVLQINLTTNGTDGIIVRAVMVAINLNGFTLTNTQAIENSNNSGILIERSNVTVQNGTIVGFSWGVLTNDSSQDIIQNLQLINNRIGVTIYRGGRGHLVQDCYIVGKGKTSTDAAEGIDIDGAASSVQVKNNQISDLYYAGIHCDSQQGSAIIHNYIANTNYGLLLGNSVYYQGNVVTNCTTPFQGGHAVGGENGGD
jgi:parallel beta-helix repeat protein